MKKTGILLLVIGAVVSLLSLAFPWGFQEEQPFIQSSYERANMLDHGTTQPSGGLAELEEHSGQALDETAILQRAEHWLFAGMILFVSGGCCLFADRMKHPRGARKLTGRKQQDNKRQEEST